LETLKHQLLAENKALSSRGIIERNYNLLLLYGRGSEAPKPFRNLAKIWIYLNVVHADVVDDIAVIKAGKFRRFVAVDDGEVEGPPQVVVAGMGAVQNVPSASPNSPASETDASRFRRRQRRQRISVARLPASSFGRRVPGPAPTLHDVILVAEGAAEGKV
jgi:hypothetical protein